MLLRVATSTIAGPLASISYSEYLSAAKMKEEAGIQKPRLPKRSMVKGEEGYEGFKIRRVVDFG
jgi:hypothetical protein